jgi:hypothetical protein
LQSERLFFSVTLSVVCLSKFADVIFTPDTAELPLIPEENSGFTVVAPAITAADFRKSLLFMVVLFKFCINN